MKQNSQLIQDLAKKLFRHNQGLQSAQLMHPKRDWLLGVLVGLLIIILMIGWSAYTYLEKRDAIGLNNSSAQAEIPVYRSDTVEDALALFEQRKEAFVQLSQSDTPAVPIEPVDDVSSATTSTTTDQAPAEPISEVVTEESEGQIVTPQTNPSEQQSDSPENSGTPTLID